MVEQSDAARRPYAEACTRPDALAYWYLQEITPLDAGDPDNVPSDPADDGPRWASGWWLGPAILLALPAWVALGMALF